MVYVGVRRLFAPRQRIDEERTKLMRNQEAPCRIHRHISTQQVGSETLVYDELRHRAFCLNASSSVIWNLCDGERTIAEMSAAASRALGTPVSEDLVRFALEELRRDGLVELRPEVESGPAMSRRAILQSLGVGGALLLPAVAAIMAPTAAQAQSGCVDCGTDVDGAAAQAARARRLQQLNNSQSGSAPSGSPQQ
jgi:DNA-binding transcriptional ArsR family regulator